MKHDIDYLYSGLDLKNNSANYVNPKLNPADFSLIKRTDSLLRLNPSTWSNPPSDPDYARRYGNAANFIFKVKYNYQLMQDLFR